MFRFKSQKRKKRFIIFLSISGFILLLFLGAVEYTSHSKFCSSCHYMKPFFKSWEESSHRQFECSVCHYPPGGIRSKLRKKIEGLVMVGRYWTKLYVKSKPWAEIRDESCLREGCHDKRLLEGQVKFKKVVFDHKIHFSDLRRGKQLQCTSCHSQIVQGEHITVTESSCFICHFKESEHYPQIKDCSHCHKKEELTDEKTSRFNHTPVFDNGFSCNKCHSNTIVGDGAVPRENCYKCHGEQERLEKYDDTDLMHAMHIYINKIECNQCHMEIQHKIVRDIQAIADCQSCHLGTHKAQEILFTGTGGKGVVHPMPNIMLEKGLSCKGCHMFHEESGGRQMRSETFVSKAEACESCHGKGFAWIMNEWEVSTEKKLKEIKVIYGKARQEMSGSGSNSKQKAQELLAEAAFNMDVVERGKSVHNVGYSQELLFASYDKIIDALKFAGSSYQPKPLARPAEAIPTSCSVCHTGIEEVSLEIFGLEFPHKKHLIEQKILCSTCHSNARRHGELIATKQSCAVCHHKDTARDCSLCHKLQASFYQGGKLMNQDVPKDIMAEAGVDCQSCHLGPKNQIIRPDKTKCSDCHDQDYPEMFIDWQQTTKDLLLKLKASVQETRQLALNGQQKAQLSEIEEFVNNVELDGSSGVHNYSFIEGHLTNSLKKIESVKKSK